MTFVNLLELVKSDDFVVLDTETTGLGDAEIVQICVMDAYANTLINTLVKPVSAIPRDAIQIHGITNAMVADCFGWGHWHEAVKQAIGDKSVIVYNADFDRRMMLQTCLYAGVQDTYWIRLVKWRCAMKHYAQHYGDWSDYHQSYRWKTLEFACNAENVEFSGGHSAQGDCMSTLRLLRKLAAQLPEK